MRRAAPVRLGSQEAVLVGSQVLATIYTLLVPAYLGLLDGVPRLVMVPLTAVTAAVLWALARTLHRLEDATVEWLPVVMCGLPLLDALTHLALAGRLFPSAVVMLVVVVSGAVCTTRRVLVAVVVTAWLGWVAVVLTTHPQPIGHAPFWSAQLVLAGVLSGAVLEMRLSGDRRLTRAIERSEHDLRRFRSVFDDSPVGIGLADENGLFVEANPALCELLARPSHEVIGHSSAEFTHPGDLAAHARAGEMVDEASDGIARVEKRYLRPDGEVRWAWLSFARVAGPAGETWTLAHMQDVTTRHHAEEELRLSRESMVAAVEIAQATQNGLDPRPVILEHLKRLAGASFVTLLEPLGDDRLVVTAVDGDLDLVGLSMSRHEPSVPIHVWNTGKPVFASQVAPHPEVSPLLLSTSGAASLLWQPVGVAGDPLAVLSIAWDDPMPGVEKAGRAAVEAVAAEAGAALTGEAMRRELEMSTVTDMLTGLLNRRGWTSEVERIRQHTERTGTPFTLAVVDLDHFKRYNDTLGHLAGDDALRAFAQAAKDSLRAVDVVSRWGGEEFAVALHATGGDEAVIALERLRTRAPQGLTCSVGYVEVRPGDDLHEALARADAALYEAKSTGRDRVVGATVRAETRAEIRAGVSPAGRR